MSINACNINSHTIDAICGYRRGPILDNLINGDHSLPAAGTNNFSVRRAFARLRPDLIRHTNQPVDPPWTFEVPTITVTIRLDGENKTQSLFAPAAPHETVVALGLNLTDKAEQITVNILDLQIEKK